MKIQRFTLPREMDAWEALISQEGVKVEHQYIASGAGLTEIYVLFSFIEERLDAEIKEYCRIKEIASRVKDDKVLPSLKNARQRELYFLEKYSLDSVTAGDVWEYLKMKEKEKEVVSNKEVIN